MHSRRLFSIILFLFYTFSPQSGHSQECSAVSYGNIGDLDVDIFVDSNGNSYVYENNHDGFHYFAKYNSAGDQVFFKRLDIEGSYFLADVTGDDNSVYIITSFVNYRNDNELISTEGQNGLILKYDTEGNLLWEKVFRTDSKYGYARLTTGVVDQNGDLFVGMNAAEEVEVDASFYGDIPRWASIYKFDEAGNLIWVKESEGNARFNEMAVTPNGNIVAAMWSLSDHFTFGGEIAETEGLILKVDSNGDVIYLHSTFNPETNTSIQLLYDVAVENEDVYYLGAFNTSYSSNGVVYEPVNNMDGIVCRLDFKGELDWSKTIRTEGSAEGWGALGLGGDQVHILTPTVFEESDLLLLDEEEIQVEGSPATMLITLDNQSGDYLSSQNISITPNEGARSIRGSKLIGNTVYLPFSRAFNPDTDHINGKPNSFAIFDLSDLEEVNHLRVRFSEHASPAGSYADDALPMLEVAGEMISGQWFKDRVPMAGETSQSLEIGESGAYHYEAIFEEGCTNRTTARTYNIVENSLENDSLLLVQFYDDSDGDEWTNNSGWLSAPLSEWYGVSTENERVVSLQLPANNLSSYYLNDLIGLTRLQTLDISNNDLNLQGDDLLSELNSSLVSVDLSGNNFRRIPNLGFVESVTHYDVSLNSELEVEDLEPNASIESFLYSNFTNNTEKCFEVELGQSLQLSGESGGQFGVYAWEKDGEQIGNFDSSLDLASIDESDLGTYKLTVTNALLPGITEIYWFTVDAYTGSLLLPTGTDFEAYAITQFADMEYATNTVVTIENSILNSEGFYDISDVSGGFYSSFSFRSGEAYTVALQCGDIEIVHEVNSSFPIISTSPIVWDEANGQLIIEWRDTQNNIDGVTTILIDKKTQEVSWPLKETYRVGENIPFDAQASSGLPVQYNILEGQDLISESGDIRNALNVGRVTIEAMQPGDGTYGSNSVVRTFDIVRSDVTIDFQATQVTTFDGVSKEFVIDNKDDGLTYLITYNGASTAPILAGNYKVEITAYSDRQLGHGEGTLEIRSGTLNAADATISFYPNPAVDFVNLSGLYDSSWEVKIYDLNGKVRLQHGGGSSIPVSVLSAGLYILELSNNNSIIVRNKLLIE